MSAGWAVVIAKSNMERRVLVSCEPLRLPTYLPRYADLRGRERLLFPGYVFVDCEEDRASDLFHLRGGLRPLMNESGRLARLPLGTIRQFRARENLRGMICFDERFKQDQALLVVDGPYKNNIVLYRGMDRDERELALFSLLGREVVKAFDRDELEALPTEKLN
jgi:hypothetical protein